MEQAKKEPGWSEKFQEKEWLNCLENGESEVEKVFGRVVKDIGDRLKRQILEKSLMGSEEVVSYLQEVGRKFVEVLGERDKEAQEKLETSQNEIGNLKLPEGNEDQKKEVKESNSEKSEEIKSDEDSEELQAIGNLFSRVLKIFYIDGRDIQELFEALDVSKDGKITPQELRLGLLKYDPSITQEETESVFNILDGNKDGHISLDEITKRIKLIHEKAEAEDKDPLANIVFSKPLDPDLIHGNLSIILTKASNLKPGSHSVKISIKDSLEYLTADTQDLNPNFNFRCEFLFENQTESSLPAFVNLELFNKGKLEGSGSFLWKKAMDSPNEFTYKYKSDVKTSTGQVRGALFFSVKWTPIVIKIQPDQEKLEKIKELVQKKKSEQELQKKEEEEERIKEEVIELQEEGQNLVRVFSAPIEYFYVTHTISKVVRSVQAPVKFNALKNREIEKIDVKVNRNSTGKLGPVSLKQQMAASKIQSMWKSKKK